MSTDKLPRENSERVQSILFDGRLSLEEKAQQIYSYDDMCLSREYDRRKPVPEKTVHQILMILVERSR